MTIIAFPSILPSSINFQLVTNTRISNSPWTNTSQYEELDGAKFIAELKFTNLSQDEARDFQGFLFAANGPINTFYVQDPLFTESNPASYGSPIIQVGTHTGKTLPTQGWTASTLVLKKGSYISVDGSFRGVTADVTSDGTGLASIPLSHRLYKTPVALSPIVYQNPTCLMNLIDDKQGKRPSKPPFNSNFSIKAQQVINL